MNVRASRTAIAALALLAAACGYDITTQNVQSSSRSVVTYYATGVAFPAGATYAIVSQLGQVTDDPSTAGTVSAPTILSQIASDLQARGFVEAVVVDPATPPSAPVAADLAVNVTSLDATAGFGAYWQDSAGHFSPATFGFPGAAWRYPWPWQPYPAKPGTVLVELADLRTLASGSIEVAWIAELRSLGTGAYDSSAALAAVDQAFAQSPYLVAGGSP